VHSRKFALGLALPALAALGLCPVIACKPDTNANAPVHPVIPRDAERQVASLEALWVARGTENQASLVEPTRHLILAYPNAPELYTLRLSLATYFLAQGLLGDAEAFVQPLLEGDESLTRDEASMLLGEVRIAEGRGSEALELLKPLGPRLVTEEARARYASAMVRAALSARSWRLALENLIQHLSEGSRNSEQTEALVRRVLAEVPIEAQRRMLEDWPTALAAPKVQPASELVRRMVLESLIGVALSRQDARLARDLVQSGPAWVRRGERGEKLMLLASLALDHAQVSSRTVGTVLGGRSAALTRRTVNATTGLGQVLHTDLQLITEDDRGALEDSLAALVGQGAGILIAGVDELSVSEALGFAEHHQVPVLLLGPTSVTTPTKFGFFLGTNLEAEEAALRKGLSEVLASPRAPTIDPSLLVAVCTAVDSLATPQWNPQAKALLVVGDTGCADRVLSNLRPLKTPPRLAFGLEAAPVRIPGSYYLRSHEYPPSGSTGSLSESWYVALGRDAARLANHALMTAPLPHDQTPESLRQYHDALRVALVEASLQLETSSAARFQADNRLERSYSFERAE